MTVETDPYAAWMEQAALALRTLGQHMVSGRQEFIAMHLDEMYRYISLQEQSCRQIQALCAVADAMHPSLAAQAGTGPALAERRYRLRSELVEMQAEVNRLNQIQSAYLRRCGRTVNMLINALGGSGPTYTPARIPSSSRATGAG